MWASDGHIPIIQEARASVPCCISDVVPRLPQSKNLSEISVVSGQLATQLLS